MNRSRGDGIANDTFCHLIDVWVESKLRRIPDGAIDKAVGGLDPFRKAHGDRFTDADDLARAIDHFSLIAAPRQKKAALPLLTDLLAMWRSIEE